METYVTIHDQDLLLACELEGRFDELSHTYLFVGGGAIDRVPADVKLVLAREYDGHVEGLPQFYDFTGWHVLAQHRLVRGDRFLAIQYDHRLRLDGRATAEQVDAAFEDGAGVVATVSGYYNNWILQWPRFDQTLRDACAACGLTLRTAEAASPFDRWPSTQGTAWNTDFFYAFMEWFQPTFATANRHVLAGHVAERMVQAYCLFTGRPAGYAEGLLVHESADCHGTGDLMRGNHAAYESKKALFAAGFR